MTPITYITRTLSSGLLLPVGIFIWLAWICADDWNHDPNYSYGWFILPLGGYFLYRRLNALPPDEIKTNAISAHWLYLVPPLVLVLELIRLTPIVWRAIPWSIFAIGVTVSIIMIYRHTGRTGLSELLFPVLFFALSIPWPTFIEVTIIREFSFWVASVVGETLLLSGFFCQVKGKIITLANGTVGVDEACSGLRSLQAALMVGFALGEWHLMQWKHRAALVLLAITTAFVSNLLRAYVLSLLIVSGGQPLFNEWHDTIGMIAMIGLTLAIIGLALLFPRQPERAQRMNWHVLPEKIIFWKQGLSVTIATFICFIAAHLWYAIHAIEPSPETPFLSDATWSDTIRQEAPPETVFQILRADSGGYKLTQSPTTGEIIGYQFFWKPARSNGKVFFHRPDVCMPGGGWVQEGTAKLIKGKLNGRDTTIHHFYFSRGTHQTNLYWICWTDNRTVAFEASDQSYLQAAFLTEFIQLGKRVFSVEIFGIATSVVPENSAEWNTLLAHLGDLHFELDE
ncbi:MAG: exosortase/archaeosortase family protein [Verrucomicrobiota bacterium]